MGEFVFSVSSLDSKDRLTPLSLSVILGSVLPFLLLKKPKCRTSFTVYKSTPQYQSTREAKNFCSNLSGFCILG